MSLFRLDIAPLTPLPLTRSPLFSYRSHEAVPLGSLVAIPFGARQLQGIVFHCEILTGKAPLWLKPIHRVLAYEWLNASQRSLAQTLSERYFSSLGNVLKHFVYPLPKKIDPVTPLKTKPRQRRPKERWYEAPSDQALLAWITTLLKRRTVRSGQCLILVPDLFLAEILSTQLQVGVTTPIITLTSRLSKKQLFEQWQVIRSGTPTIIIGTRQALFAPFCRLEHIIVLFPEERLSYKQWDMTPYYEATELVRVWSHLSGANVTWASTALDLGSEVSHPTTVTQITTPVILDRRLDGRGARSKIFGTKLLERLRTLGSKRRILLIAKERGVSGVLVCEQCRTTARCPQCEHILSEVASGQFRCRHCQYTSSIFPACQKCHGLHFKSFGFGTVRVEREWEKLFPQDRILRIDRDRFATVNERRAVRNSFETGDYDVLITTHEIGTLLPLPPLDFIAMLESDHALAFPGYQTEERLLIELRRLSAKLRPRATLVVQTFAPEERIWQYSLKNDIASLLEELRAERVLLGYPPAVALIQLSASKITQEPQTLHKIHGRLAQLIAPLPHYSLTPLFRKGKHSSTPTFLLKYPPAALDATVTRFLKQESAHLTIDVHPFDP